jgi:hypothetical protein
MLLSVDNVENYLASRRLLPSGGAREVADISRSHRVLRVVTDGGILVVKQARPVTASEINQARAEAAVLRAAAHDESLRRLTPRLALHDAANEILVTEARPGAESYSTLARRVGAAPPGVSGRIAVALAGQHVGAAATRLPLRRQCPAILALGHAPPSTWLKFGPIGPLVRARLDRRPRLARAVDAAQCDWRAEAFLHGDLGLENIVLHPASAQHPLFYFVDWEMACLGDPGWDLATLLRPRMVARLMGGPIEGLLSPGVEACPGVEAWRAYAAARGWRGDEEPREFESVARLAAIQIAWMAIDRSRRQPKFDSATVDVVEAALALAAEPNVAAKLLAN